MGERDAREKRNCLIWFDLAKKSKISRVREREKEGERQRESDI